MKETKRKAKESAKRGKLFTTTQEAPIVPSEKAIPEPPTKYLPPPPPPVEVPAPVPVPEPKPKVEPVLEPQQKPVLPPVPTFTGGNPMYNPALFYNGLFFGQNNPLANYMLLQKGISKPAEPVLEKPEKPKEEKKAIPFKRQTSHVGIAHYIERTKKNEAAEQQAKASLLGEIRGVPPPQPRDWKDRPDFPYGLGYPMIDAMTQRYLRTMQEIGAKEFYDKGLH